MTATGACVICGVSTSGAHYKGSEFVGWFCNQHYPQEGPGDEQYGKAPGEAGVEPLRQLNNLQRNLLKTTNPQASRWYKHLCFTIELIPLEKGWAHAIHFGTQIFHGRDNVAVTKEEALAVAKAAIDQHKNYFRRQAQSVGAFSWENNRRSKAGRRR